MSDTFFTKPPHWEWFVIIYFFVGGIAAGSYVIAALLDLFGDSRDRPVVRLGYYVALVEIVLSGALLAMDLGRPERFWHMLIESKRGWPMLKWWSPMSLGSWGISAFGFFALLSTLMALEEGGTLRWSRLRKLREGMIGKVITVLGAVFGFFVAGYAGILLSVTNRPMWANTHFLGVLFLFSATSTAAAALILLGLWRGAVDTVRWLSRLDRGALVLEFLALIALVVSLGSVARVWESVPAGAVLVLLGGFLMRMVIVLSSEGV